MGYRRKNGKVRFAARRSDAKLSRQQIKACYTLYQSGKSVPEIAELIWHRFGFKSKRACINTIYHAFYGYRLETRTFTQANHLRWGDKKCAGCGCDFDSRTRGCVTCKHRHSKRRQAGQAYVLLRERCAGCGTEFSNYTKGCRQCGYRRYARNKRQKALDRAEPV
jgi:hypothetical protein